MVFTILMFLTKYLIATYHTIIKIQIDTDIIAEVNNLTKHQNCVFYVVF